MAAMKPDFTDLADKWPSTVVAREKIGEFTGGLVSPKTMANLDALGKGCPGRIRMGRKTGYLLMPLIKWLAQRSEVI